MILILLILVPAILFQDYTNPSSPNTPNGVLELAEVPHHGASRPQPLLLFCQYSRVCRQRREIRWVVLARRCEVGAERRRIRGG
jgi:hypothetical protein